MTDVIDKIDLKTFIGDLEKEEKPKTLEECLKEAGGFPFAAKAVVSSGVKDEWPTGIELRFTRHTDDGGFDPRAIHPKFGKRLGVCGNFHRWQLLGHKT